MEYPAQGEPRSHPRGPQFPPRHRRQGAGTQRLAPDETAVPSGPANRAALYLLGLLATLKALSLVLMGQAVASMLAGLMAGDPPGVNSCTRGVAGVVSRSLTVWAQAVASRRAALGVKEELRSQLLERALRNGTRAAGPSDGGLAILATRGLDCLDNYYTQFLPALVNCAAIPLLLGARILFADWISAVVIVLTVPLVPLFMVLIGRYTEDRVREAQSGLSRLSGHMLELAKGLPVLVGLGRATAQRKALEDISEEYRHRTMGTLRTAFLSALALELIATISVAVVAVFIGVRLVHGDMALEAGLLALILAPDCYLPLRELGTAHHASDEGRAALAETTAVLEAPEAAPLRPVAAAGAGLAHEAGTGEGRPPALVVDGLTVRYGGRTNAAVGPSSSPPPQAGSPPSTAPAAPARARPGRAGRHHRNRRRRRPARPANNGHRTARRIHDGGHRLGAAASRDGRPDRAGRGPAVSGIRPWTGQTAPRPALATPPPGAAWQRAPRSTRREASRRTQPGGAAPRRTGPRPGPDRGGSRCVAPR